MALPSWDSPEVPSVPRGPARTRTLLGTVSRSLFGLSAEEALFTRRGFPGLGAPTQPHLERVGATFIQGYNLALEDAAPQALVPALEAVELPMRGFAFEGAAMALALLDMLTPWNGSRLQAFLGGGAEPHIYMVHVGAGWAWARLRRDVPRMLARVDPLLGWLAVDGYGFHEGYFQVKRYVERQAPPPLRGYAARVFDQGLGRSLWFVEGARVERIIARVRSFPAPRHSDLWSGLGLACTYAGGVEREALVELSAAAGPLWPHLAQGAVFAARARQRAGNMAPHTGLACEVICGRGAEEAAAIAESTLAVLGAAEGEPPRFERWRQAIQQAISSEGKRT